MKTNITWIEWAVVLLLAAWVLLFMGAVWGSAVGAPAFKLTEETCVEVRKGVATYGPVEALRWAKKNGYTSVQIMKARKCLKKEQS